MGIWFGKSPCTAMWARWIAARNFGESSVGGAFASDEHPAAGRIASSAATDIRLRLIRKALDI
jgi:hypothetical protein